jgi:hypothetical protein
MFAESNETADSNWQSVAISSAVAARLVLLFSLYPALKRWAIFGSWDKPTQKGPNMPRPNWSRCHREGP